jgi:hypothetical protein
LFGVAVSPILIAVGIAILRYRLYEIDLEGDAQRIESLEVLRRDEEERACA